MLITKIVIPQRLNSTELAHLYYHASGGSEDAWNNLADMAKQVIVDRCQIVLDSLVAEGILGTE